jgi:hypothetical protein
MRIELFAIEIRQIYLLRKIIKSRTSHSSTQIYVKRLGSRTHPQINMLNEMRATHLVGLCIVALTNPIKATYIYIFTMLKRSYSHETSINNDHMGVENRVSLSFHLILMHFHDA